MLDTLTSIGLAASTIGLLVFLVAGVALVALCRTAWARRHARRFKAVAYGVEVIGYSVVGSVVVLTLWVAA